MLQGWIHLLQVLIGAGAALKTLLNAVGIDMGPPKATTAVTTTEGLADGMPAPEVADDTVTQEQPNETTQSEPQTSQEQQDTQTTHQISQMPEDPSAPSSSEVINDAQHDAAPTHSHHDMSTPQMDMPVSTSVEDTAEPQPHDHGDEGHSDEMQPDHEQASHEHHHFEQSSDLPGVSASEADIAVFVEDLAQQPEAHVHDHGDSKMTEHNDVMDLVARADATVVAIASGDWSDPAIWSTGDVPDDDARVLIPDGAHVLYSDVSDARLFSVRIDGKLEFATDQDSQMIFDTMVVSPTGKLEIGTEENPVASDVQIDLIVANNGEIDTDWDPSLLSRGLISHGDVSMHGANKDSHEKVLSDPMTGDTSISFDTTPEGWQVGDTIVIAGTRYEGYKYDKDTNGKKFFEGEDEVRTITNIDGNTISFDTALEFDHDTPREDLKTSVANYSRNITLQTEDPDTAEVHERGHVMFMHSDDVDVRYVEFHELGRTDKSETSFDISNLETVTAESNVQGRYALHLHRTGTEDVDNPAVVEGSSVWGTPGWGFVHHDSNALLSNNASYDTFGAGYVAETGNEIGDWTDNIAINAQGPSWAAPKNTTKIGDDHFDTARGGHGFWFQGRLVNSEDNIASTVNTGFVYFHRDGDDRMIEVQSDHFLLPDALLNDSTDADNIPILSFSNNETFAAREGLHVVKSNPLQGHDISSHLNDFTAWNVVSGAHMQYTAHYILKDFDLIGKEDQPFSTAKTGISMGNNTSDITIIGGTISGFNDGIDLFKNFEGRQKALHGDDESLHEYNVVGTDLSGNDNALLNYLPEHDGHFDALPNADVAPSLDLEITNDFEVKTVTLGGTKTDSLGQIDYPTGTDVFEYNVHQIAHLLTDRGYWETTDGQKYTLMDVYFTDRGTGDVYSQTHQLMIDNKLPLGFADREMGMYEHATFHGVQDLEMKDSVLYAGDTALETATNLNIFAEDEMPLPVVQASAHMDEAMPHTSMMEESDTHLDHIF